MIGDRWGGWDKWGGWNKLGGRAGRTSIRSGQRVGAHRKRTGFPCLPGKLFPGRIPNGWPNRIIFSWPRTGEFWPRLLTVLAQWQPILPANAWLAFSDYLAILPLFLQLSVCPNVETILRQHGHFATALIPMTTRGETSRDKPSRTKKAVHRHKAPFPRTLLIQYCLCVLY